MLQEVDTHPSGILYEGFVRQRSVVVAVQLPLVDSLLHRYPVTVDHTPSKKLGALESSLNSDLPTVSDRTNCLIHFADLLQMYEKRLLVTLA